jgi:hypothetical protein
MDPMDFVELLLLFFEDFFEPFSPFLVQQQQQKMIKMRNKMLPAKPPQTVSQNLSSE